MTDILQVKVQFNIVSVKELKDEHASFETHPEIDKLFQSICGTLTNLVSF